MEQRAEGQYDYTLRRNEGGYLTQEAVRGADVLQCVEREENVVGFGRYPVVEVLADEIHRVAHAQLPGEAPAGGDVARDDVDARDVAAAQFRQGDGQLARAAAHVEVAKVGIDGKCPLESLDALLKAGDAGLDHPERDVAGPCVQFLFSRDVATMGNRTQQEVIQRLAEHAGDPLGLCKCGWVVLSVGAIQECVNGSKSLSENPSWTISWQQKRRSRARCHPPVRRILPILPRTRDSFAAVYEREPSLRSGFSLMLAQLGYSDRL